MRGEPAPQRRMVSGSARTSRPCRAEPSGRNRHLRFSVQGAPMCAPRRAAKYASSRRRACAHLLWRFRGSLFLNSLVPITDLRAGPHGADTSHPRGAYNLVRLHTPARRRCTFWHGVNICTFPPCSLPTLPMMEITSRCLPSPIVEGLPSRVTSTDDS